MRDLKSKKKDRKSRVVGGGKCSARESCAFGNKYRVIVVHVSQACQRIKPGHVAIDNCETDLLQWIVLSTKTQDGCSTEKGLANSLVCGDRLRLTRCEARGQNTAENIDLRVLDQERSGDGSCIFLRVCSLLEDNGLIHECEKYELKNLGPDKCVRAKALDRCEDDDAGQSNNGVGTVGGVGGVGGVGCVGVWEVGCNNSNKHYIYADDLRCGNVCITRPGLYCVMGHAKFNGTRGAMIRICADDVTLDLGSFTLSGGEGMLPGCNSDSINNVPVLSYVTGILIAAFENDETNTTATGKKKCGSKRGCKRKSSCAGSPCTDSRRTLRNIVVRNGSVNSFTGAGITAFNVDNLLVENVQLDDNGNDTVCDFSTCAATRETFRFVSGGVAVQNSQNVTLRHLIIRRAVGFGITIRNDISGKRYVIEDCQVSCTRHRARDCIGRDPDANPCAPQPLSADTMPQANTRAFDISIISGTVNNLRDVPRVEINDIIVRDCVMGSHTRSENRLDSSVGLNISTEIFNAEPIQGVLVERCTVQNVVAPRAALGLFLASIDGLLCQDLQISGLQTTRSGLSITLSGITLDQCRNVVVRNAHVSNLSTTSDSGAFFTNGIIASNSVNVQIEQCKVQDIDLSESVRLLEFCNGISLDNVDSATVSSCRVDSVLTDDQLGYGIVTSNGSNLCIGDCHVSRCDLAGLGHLIEFQFLVLEGGLCYVDGTTTPGPGEFSTEFNAPPSGSTKVYVNLRDKNNQEQPKLRLVTAFNLGPLVATQVPGPCDREVPSPEGTFIGFQVITVTVDDGVLTYEVLFSPDGDNDVPFIDGAAYEFEAFFVDPKPELTLRDNKIERNLIGANLELRSNPITPTDNTAIALYRNEFICNNQATSSAVITFPPTPFRQWTLGQMPAPQVAGPQLDNLEIRCCQPQRQLLVANILSDRNNTLDLSEADKAELQRCKQSRLARGKRLI